MQASKNLLSVETYGTRFIPPDKNCQNTCHFVYKNVVYQGSLLEIQFPRFLLDLAYYVGTLPQHLPKVWILSRKADVQHKSYFKHKQLKHSEQLLSIIVVGTRLKSGFPHASQGPAAEAGLSKDSSLKPAVLTFLPADLILN